jgi:hypothetical protein
MITRTITLEHENFGSVKVTVRQEQKWEKEADVPKRAEKKAGVLKEMYRYKHPGVKVTIS